MDNNFDKQWINDAMHQATPVARRWANHLIKEKATFEEVKNAILTVTSIENKLYESMKTSLIDHIERHGLDAVGLKFLEDFAAIKQFEVHSYEKVLRHVRQTFVRNEEKIKQLQSGHLKIERIATPRQKQELTFDLSAEVNEYQRQKKWLNYMNRRANVTEQAISGLQKQNENLEYLISKINEFLRKVHDLNTVAFQMLLDGKSPDLESWSVQKALQDNLFEENKQFLKQTLHHIESLEKNRCELGIAEIRLLLYHEQGCRRMKLYNMVETQIIDIFYKLKSEDERRQIYPEICSFVERLVPQVGYISPCMINFIFDRGFISKVSRDLLLNIKPVISQLNMNPLILIQLKKFFSETLERMQDGKFSETDEYVLEIMQAYSPKEISPKLQMLWDELKKSQTK